MSTVARHQKVHGQGPVGQALQSFAHDTGPGIGFCYRPADVRWFRFDADGAPTGPDGTALDLTGVFEMRAFTTDTELRWRNTSAGTGTAVQVSDGATGQRLRHERLLWGVAVDPQPATGWVALHDARIGVLDVPVGGSKPTHGHLVWLQVVEYLEEDQHGNVAVVDERLTGLVHRPQPAASEDKDKDKKVEAEEKPDE